MSLKGWVKEKIAQRDLRAVLQGKKQLGGNADILHHKLGKNLIFELSLDSIKKHINKHLSLNNNTILPKHYFLIRGNWAAQACLIEEDETYKDLENLIETPNNVQNTILYQRYMQKLELGKPQVHGSNFLDSESKVREYCLSPLQLYKSIQKNGYKKIDYSKNPHETHIGVCLDDQGNFLHFRTGHHRIAIAKMLGIKTIPVQLHFLHPDALLLEKGPPVVKKILQHPFFKVN